MSRLYRLLEKVRMDAEEKVQEEFKKGGLLVQVGFKMIAPIRVNIITDAENASMIFSGDGKVTLQKALIDEPDVSIRSDNETLEDLFTSPSSQRFDIAERQGRIKIVSHSFKGSTAVSKIKEIFER